MWTAVRQEDFPECSGGLAVPAIDNCGLRQDSIVTRTNAGPSLQLQGTAPDVHVSQR